MIAIASRLARGGCEVGVHTWFRWEDHIIGVGAEFFRAPKFEVGPDEEIPDVHEAAALAADQLRQVVQEWRPDVIVADVLTLSAALAAELCDVPFITFVPHFWHATDDDSVPFGSGWSPPTSWIARRFFRQTRRLEQVGLEQGRRELNQARIAVGLGEIDRVHGALSRDLVLVGTYPQLEPPRRWPAHVKVVGPVMWEAASDPVDVPTGDAPLVVVAPSTAQDLSHSMLTAAVKGLARLPLRVIAAKNGREPPKPLEPGPNTTVVDWAPYGQLFPMADVVLCHGGHGTMMRALSSGAPLVITPSSGDQYENAARIRWAGVGVAVPPRFVSQRTIAAAVEKVLAEPRYKQRSTVLARWAAGHDAALEAATEIQAFAAARIG